MPCKDTLPVTSLPFTKSCLLKVPPSPRSSTGRGKVFLTQAFGEYARSKLPWVYGDSRVEGGLFQVYSLGGSGQAIRCGPAVGRKDDKLGEKIRKVACCDVYGSVVF